MESEEDKRRTKRSSSLPKLGVSENHKDRKNGNCESRKKISIFDKNSQPSPHKCCATTRMCWWEPSYEDRNDTVDFTQETSLHGLKFICQPQRHLIERIFWLIAFIISLIIAGFLISDIWIKYINSPVIVTFQPTQTTIDKIPFPAVTICNMNLVQKNQANRYLKSTHPELRKNIYYMDHVCTASKSFSKKFNYSSMRGEISDEEVDSIKIKDGDDEQRDVAKFLRLASQRCTDMLLLCLWLDEPVNCSKLFKPIETDFGKCCVFNMMPSSLLTRSDTSKTEQEDSIEIAEWSVWDYEKDGLLMQDSENSTKTFPRRQFKAGKSSGLSVLLQPDLEEYFCTSSDSQGFRLVKHLPLELPRVVDFGVAIRPNSEIFMGVRPEITIGDPDIRSFKIENRQCYFRNEFTLAYFKYYTAASCVDECLANLTYARCGCVRYYMPRDDSRDICGPGNFNCVENIRRLSVKTGIKSQCPDCLPTCTELEYFSETTVTPIQKGVNLWYDKNNTLAKWGKKNVSIVHIYFASDSTYARVRKELFGITDLIANTGGLLGLTLGFSGLSLIELIYFYTLRAWCRTRRRESIWNIVVMKLHRLWLRAQSSERYNNRNAFDRPIGSIPSISSENFSNNRLNGRFEEVNLHSKNPFMVSQNHAAWGRFPGYETQFSNS